MNAAVNLPLWQFNSPPNSPDSTGDLDLFIGRLSSDDKQPFYGVSEVDSQIPLDNGMPARRSSSSVSDCDCASKKKFEDAWRLNNNVNDSGDCGLEKCNSGCARRRIISSKRRFSLNETADGDSKDERSRVKRRKSSIEDSEHLSGATDNVACEISSECDAGTVGGDDDDDDGNDDEDDDDDGDEKHKRSLRRQHELASSGEINKFDVIKSRDITSNPSRGGGSRGEEGYGTCESNRRGSCSAGSYSRRKHHKHRKQKRRSKSPVAEEPVSPRVNPIFLWVRQDDTRIVEVMCEDYDHRNRIRLTRTHLGWRAIPKTERFTAAIIPKAPPAKETARKETDARPKRRKKAAKKRKAKRRKVSMQPNESLDSVEEPSATFTQDDVFQCQEDSSDDMKNHSRSDSESRTAAEPSVSSPHPSRSLIAEFPELESLGDVPVFRLTKSVSCDLSIAYKRATRLSRSRSLNENMDEETRLELRDKFRVQKKSEDVTTKAEKEAEDKSVPTESVKTEVEDVTKEDAKTEEQKVGKLPAEVPDITKHNPDSNDTDCDELRQLLKDIPDLEFVEEAEDEELKNRADEEDDEWSVPTDLTMPKAKCEDSESAKANLTVLPMNISPVVTVTSTTRPSEPLTAPLPEVTITPIPNLKPAHQQKPQNNFLESLLSSPYPVKPEKDDINTTRSSGDKRGAEKKKLGQSEADTRNKKMILEDITLKSLLSKHRVDKSVKGAELENYVKKMKSKQERENLDMSKSRLHELLTEGVTLGGADPIAQLKQVLSNPDLAVPDPLLVPRARLPALVASPASEIPRLLTMHLDKKIEETPCPPLTDSDMLEVSLSYLRSLLSCNPDKMKSTDAEDLASYQKSLEVFLEWQRYQSELMEAQMKNASLAPADIDLATATALNQMLWLPYLELNSNAVSPSMNSAFPHNYPLAGGLATLPHISTNHFAQPSPFLTPTSPMDIDTQMKTLAMWQETLVAQQNSHSSRKVPSALLSSMQQDGRGLKMKGVSLKKHRSSPVPSPQKMRNQFSPRPDTQKSHFNWEPHHRPPFQREQEAILRQQYEMQRKQQKQRQTDYQRHQIMIQQLQQHKRDPSDSERKNWGSISVKPLSNLMDKSQSRQSKKQTWQQIEQYEKNAETNGQTALQSHQFQDGMRRNQTCNKIKTENGGEWHRSVQERSHNGEKSSEMAKLKVKNLVDPGMSPPKLLKQLNPEELSAVANEGTPPIQDESQAHLWHPLFGSNQIKTQQYNSPWRWTTVTVNGE